MSDKEQLLNEIILKITKYNPDKIDDIKNELVFAFRDYEVSKMETAIVEYEGYKNEKFIKHFLISKQVEGCAERTIEYYGKTLRSILSIINKNADEITTDDIRIYLAMRQIQNKISKTTANNELRVMSSFFKHLTQEEAIIKNPCLKLKKIKQDKVEKKAFTDMEIEKIRGCCETSREKALVETLLSTGCRVSELVSITIEQTKSSELTIMGKGRKERKVYFNAKAEFAVKKYLEERVDNNPYLFPMGVDIRFSSIRKKGIKPKLWYQHAELVSPEGSSGNSVIEAIIRKIGKRAGVSECHPHKFRRTCATLALRRGMPIEQVSKMLGHNSIATTQIYLDLDEKDLESAHRKYVI